MPIRGGNVKRLLPLLLLIGCGGSATVNSAATSNTNVNVNSQNGDTQCSYHCEPVQFEGGVGYLVTQECDGTSNGPEFSPSCPSFSPAPVEVAQEAPSFEVPEETNNSNLSEGVL